MPAVAPDPVADLVVALCFAWFGASVLVFVVGSLVLDWRKRRRERAK